MKRLYLVALIALATTVARADAIISVRAMIATTIAEYFIEEQGVRVELEIGFDDLPAFLNMLPDDLYEKLGNEARPHAERMREFYRDDLPIRTRGGAPIPARLSQLEFRNRIIRDEITGEPLPPVENAEKALFAELFYPFDSPPDGLILGGPSRPITTGIGFVAYHRGIAVNDFRYLAQNCELDLNWDDPWYSRFHRPDLRRAYEAAMIGFIYIEPYDVRKEIIVRPKDLQSWIDLGLDGRERIEAEAQPELLRRITEFLGKRQTVIIDGEQIEPELARANFLRRTLRSSTVVDPPEDLDLVSATLRVIFVYPTAGLPDRVTMEWDLFNDRNERIPVSVVDPSGSFPSFVTPDNNLLVWQNSLTNAELPELIVTETPPGRVARWAHTLRWLTLGLLIATILFGALRHRGNTVPSSVALLAILCLFLTACAFWVSRDVGWPDTRRRQLVSELLHNVYQAIDFRDEKEIYEVLERSVAGDLLTDIYLETRRGLEIQYQGGARAKVKKVELIGLETEVGKNGGFLAHALWNVTGSFGHWGHIHERTNRYRATLGIEPVDGVWKLTSFLSENANVSPSVAP